MNLGALIDILKIQPPTAKVIIAAPLYMAPGKLESYRGFYDQLSIRPIVDAGFEVLVPAFLETLQAADGQVFTGYKGGDFRMHRGTAVWIAEHGESQPWSAKVRGVTNLWDSYARIDWSQPDD